MSYFDRFMEWQNYAHYLLLTLFITAVAYRFGAPIDLKMTAIIYGAVFVGDSLVHLVFWFAPEPIRWRD